MNGETWIEVGKQIFNYLSREQFLLFHIGCDLHPDNYSSVTRRDSVSRVFTMPYLYRDFLLYISGE